MKYPVRRFKNLELVLKEITPFIRNGQHVQTGKPFLNFGGMRSREILANWLVCVALNAANGVKLTFVSDPTGGDGIICDLDSGQSWPTEHIIVPKLQKGQSADAEVLVLKAIRQKWTKGGAAYAKGKTLIVFLDAAAGTWKPNRVARQLPDPLHFAGVWVVGLQAVEHGAYVYAVTHLDLSQANVPILLVRINNSFNGWQVVQIQ